MGKKKKNKNKSFYKKSIQPFLSDNRVLVAALGGAAAGISLAGLLGTEKAKQIIDQVGDAARNISNRITDSVDFSQEKFDKETYKSPKKTNSLEKQPV